jgi:hypothetical protein
MVYGALAYLIYSFGSKEYYNGSGILDTKNEKKCPIIAG